MSVSQLVQFYAPLAGLLGVVFWLGVLSEKVKTLQHRVDDLEKQDKGDADGRKLAVLESQMTIVLDSITSMKRSMDGVQRQLGNLMNKPIPHDFGAGE